MGNTILLISLGFFVLIFPFIIYLLRKLLKKNTNEKLALLDIYVMSFLAVIIIFGYFQIYIWTQHKYLGKPYIVPSTFIDKLIPRNGGIIWPYIYVIFYHIYLLSALLCLKDYKHFCGLMFASSGLMVILGIIYYIFPTNIGLQREETSSLLLQSIFKFDKTSNNFFPSGHMAFSTFNYYFLRNFLGKRILKAVPILIGLSCLRTGQHVCLDLMAGWIIGFSWYRFFLNKINPKYFPL
ncbi:MAG: phosphatase PAP2 family protein [Bacteroidetes bacterium]|nr:phosphatase PAP2 family protein [Bacteroidota bacterium]